ncbi:hypothetical protein DPMN_101945, partial [Dreissena polymorpha]
MDKRERIATKLRYGNNFMMIPEILEYVNSPNNTWQGSASTAQPLWPLSLSPA